MKNFVKVSGTPYNPKTENITTQQSAMPEEQFYLNVAAIKAVRQSVLHTFESPFGFNNRFFKNLRLVNRQDEKEIGLT